MTLEDWRQMDEPLTSPRLTERLAHLIYVAESRLQTSANRVLEAIG